MSKLRKLLSMFLVLLLVLPITGCYDLMELEGMAFVVSLGIDKAPGNMIDVTARIAVPRKLSAGPGGGGGGGGGGKDEVVGGAKPVTVRAHTVLEALNLLNTSVERRLSLIHLANIVIGESLAKEGVLEYLRPLTRYREFRRTIVVFIAPGNVREIYENNKPLLEQSITRWTESLTDVNRHTGLSAMQKLNDFIISIEAYNEDPIAAVLAVNEKVKEQMKQEKKGSEGQRIHADGKPNFNLGEVERLGGNPLEFLGTAVFHKDRLVTYLDGIDTRMLLTIRGELLRTQMDFPDPISKDRYVNLEIKHARKPIIKVDLNKRPIKVSIEESLEADLNGVQRPTDYSRPDRIRVLEKSVSERLKNRQEQLVSRVFHEYQADPFDIMKRTRSQFRTYRDLKSFDFRQVLKDAEIAVDVKLNIRRIGVQLSPIESH